MKKALTLLFGLMIAAIAVWAVPRDVKKDLPGIEKSIQMKIEVVKSQVTQIVAITEQGESPGQLVQHNYSFNILEQVAEDQIAAPIDYPYTWRTQNIPESNKTLAEIKLTWHRDAKQFTVRC